MSQFNESNTVESHLIDLLLTQGWEYRKHNSLNRKSTDIFLEDELHKAIHKHNDGLSAAQEDQILFELKRICLQSEQIGLVTANEMFAQWLRGEKTMPFGDHGQHVSINLIDFANPNKNSYIVAQQFTFRGQYERRLDLVLFVNGIPLVIGECKTPVRPAISWVDGAVDIQEYEKEITPLFVPNVLSFATEGKTFRYGGVDNPIEKWATWRVENPTEDLAEVAQAVNGIFQRKTLLDILENFSLFATTKKKRKIKILCRYQQYDAANKIVEQVIRNQKSHNRQDKQGLIWHFQGSGKSLLMVFAALKLRRIEKLGNPTIIIVVDRVDLDIQITATFQASDIPNAVTTDDRKELHTLLRQDTRKIIITTIHKFAESGGVLNENHNIIALVDEAHRTQEGDLGRAMRSALPNAFLFGLTGTPINKRDKNTFANFGGKEANGYLSRYSFQESIEDGATLPLHFETRPVQMNIEKEDLDLAFEELTKDLDENDKAALSKRAAELKNYFKSPERIKAIAKDIIKHYQERVEPNGFKAQVVCIDREACLMYKDAFDELLDNTEQSAVVITVNAGDDSRYKKHDLSKNGEEERLLDVFRDEKSSLKFLIVTNKLLTGFDAPILQTMYLDKVIKEHNLLQAICRVNRTYPNKTHGLIVDYIGVFSNVAKAFAFDEENIKNAASNIEIAKDLLPERITACLAYFPGLDRTIKGYEGLIGVSECLSTALLKDAFAQDYSSLSRLWEILSPSPILNQYETDYVWLSRVYDYTRPVNNAGRLLWHAFGAKTKALIDQHLVEGEQQTDIEMIVMDAELVYQIQNNQNPAKAKELEVELFRRVRKNLGNPKYEKLSKELESLKERAEQKLIDSVTFLRSLVECSKQLLELERGTESAEYRDSAKSALSELFGDAKYKSMPIIVEEIVKDIDDQVVKYVRTKGFEGWQQSSAAEKDVQLALINVLKKYELHKDRELYKKIYEYVKEYY